DNPIPVNLEVCQHVLDSMKPHPLMRPEIMTFQVERQVVAALGKMPTLLVSCINEIGRLRQLVAAMAAAADEDSPAGAAVAQLLETWCGGPGSCHGSLDWCPRCGPVFTRPCDVPECIIHPAAEDAAAPPLEERALIETS
ncbi:MAG: hypothetical protein HOC74_02320, partial [Gemmatimonadetes bacterium]|nr:hypothetical protein [Gemmatimonadota bacterium]